MRQTKKHPPILEVSCSSDAVSKATEVASYALNLDLDLLPFYRVATSDPRLGQIVTALRGLRPVRPASLFEMLATAITEQQISMRLARLMRERMTARYGDRIEDTPVFPDESKLASASLAGLLRCGLSHRKAEYIRDISRMVVSKRLDLENLKGMEDDDVYAALTKIRGVGPWTAEYVLLRGLGRPDRVPVDDLGVRGAVGRCLGKGRQVDSGEVLRLLRPFAPFRGLAAFYLLAYDRLVLIEGLKRNAAPDDVLR